MRQQWTLFIVMATMLVMGWLMLWGRINSNFSFSQSSQFIRVVDGLPQDTRGWGIFAYCGKLFALPLDVEEAPFTIYRIDPINEQVVESITVDRIISPEAVIAKHYQHPEAWLADQGFFFWEIDRQRNIAYAAKPFKLPANVQELGEYGFDGIYIIDMNTRKVNKFIEYPGFLHMILHPSGKKLYVEASEGKVRVLDTEKLEWVKEFFVAGYIVLHFIGFSDDGKYLFCGYAGNGFVVIDTTKDKVEEWTEQINDKAYDDYGAVFNAPFALSDDKQEIYIAVDFTRDIINVFNQSKKKAKGGVISIDLIQKRINRVLGLTQESECIGVAVIGNKLFVSSWENVFVVDIEIWRQKR